MPDRVINTVPKTKRARPRKDKNMNETAKRIYDEAYEISKTWQQKKEAAVAEREALWKEEKWDEGSAVIKKFEAENPYPFTRGRSDALRDCTWNMEKENEGFFEVRDLPDEKDLDDYLESLKEMEITTFLLTEESTALMRNLFELESHGCRITGLKTYKREDDFFGKKKELEVRGIEIEIA